jgi:hypothetical protein
LNQDIGRADAAGRRVVKDVHETLSPDFVFPALHCSVVQSRLTGAATGGRSLLVGLGAVPAAACLPNTSVIAGQESYSWPGWRPDFYRGSRMLQQIADCGRSVF